jgi:hypothetical protein
VKNRFQSLLSNAACTATVRFSAHSLTYCELYTLTSNHVATLVGQFPEARGGCGAF